MLLNLVIGLVGKPRAGKDEFVSLLEEVMREDDYFPSVGKPRFSDSLRATADWYGLIPSREILQELAQWLESKKPGAVTNGMRNLLERDRHEIKIANGVRWRSDETMIRELKGLLVYIAADKKTRFERAKKAAEKPGEENLTWEDFERQDNAKNEIYVEDIGSRADARVRNEGTKEEYKNCVRNFYERFIKPLRQPNQ